MTNLEIIVDLIFPDPTVLSILQIIFDEISNNNNYKKCKMFSALF